MSDTVTVELTPAKATVVATGTIGPSGVVVATPPATYDPATHTVGVALGSTVGTAAAGEALADEITRASAQELLKLVKTANLSDLASAVTARTNLGLGTAATHPATDFDTPTARDAAITTAVTNLINGSPGALDTLNELATALGDDANFSATVTAALGNRLLWRGAWAAATAYAVNDLVTFNGGLYRAPTAFTSGGSFVLANWVQLVPQSGTYALIDDSAYDATAWDGDTTHSPSKNAIRDKIETLGSGGSGLSLSPTAVKTAAYTAAPSDLVPVDTTAGAVTITLPAAPADKSVIVVKHVIQGGTNTVTVARGGSDVFNKAGGSTSLTLTLVNQALLVQYKASAGIWYVIADDLALSQLDGRYVTYIGTATAPITNPAQARPSTTGPVYWVMDAGIVPANAIDGDMIWTKNGPTTITSDGTVAKIVKLTQAAYNALSPDSATMYWIVG